MSSERVKAVSVTETGEPDGFALSPGFFGEFDPRGSTRLIVTIPPAWLAVVHQRLVRALEPPLSLLYRQVVNRASPAPEGTPPVDFVALSLTADQVVEALAASAGLVYADARHELWVRGRLGEQLILDQDGHLFCYPDDPRFRDVLLGEGIPEGHVETLADRDYVKHWFFADNDEQEAALVQHLRLQRL